jgi:hypothetical protein
MHLDAVRNSVVSFRGLALDTTFLLFFLGLESGRTMPTLSFDTVLIFVTMAMVAVLPYYLLSWSERPSFSRWLLGRSLIGLFSIAVGALLAPLYGTLLPEGFRFLPLTFLILAAMTSCFIQFYGLMRLRLVK